MNRNHLALFRAVAEAGSVTKAAQELHISQPAVSSQIAQLESQLGGQLFDRLPRGVRLTSLGDVLYGYSRRIGELEKSAQKAVADHLGLQTGRLAIGASTSIGSYLLPRVLGDFSLHHPGIELSLSISNTESIQQALRDGSLDLGLTEGFAAEDRFDITVFREDQLKLITPPEHELTRQSSVSLTQVLEYPLLAREPGSGTRAVLEEAFAQKGLRFTPTMSLGSSEALKRAVAAKLGLALVSELTILIELEHGLLEALTIDDFEIRRPLHLLRPLGVSTSPTAAKFSTMLREMS